MKTHIIFIGIIFVISFTLGYFDVNWILYLITIFGVLSAYLYLLYSPILFTNDILKTEAFLKKNQNKPIFYLIYSLANHLESNVEDAISKVLLKYKSPTKQAHFIAIYSLYKHDIERAKASVGQIQVLKNKEYYQALICIEEGKLKEALTIGNKIDSSWMKHTINAEVYLKEGNEEKARNYAKQAIRETKGIQKYLLYKNFEKILDGKL
ncbi:hypothetical protein E2K98_12905 [Bacillus salipaludis]|uniref:Tetratricopeptide repeat protein n=1 Tax=Bacillus salipaludis TaxID=2547811 RepID=A0A4R5VUM6_9BACI|nr:hypothetical protein [Bacillus salipaludis]TDK61782.1 hypothetical protein E2K98_12905 [Bacillus salipaludis]